MKQYLILISVFLGMSFSVNAGCAGKLGIENNTDQFLYVSFYNRYAPVWFAVPGKNFDLRGRQMLIGSLDRISHVTYHYGPQRDRHDIDVTKLPRGVNTLITVHEDGSHTLQTVS